MRKISVTMLITLLAVSCFAIVISQGVAQSTDPSITPPPLVVQWMRYHGAVSQWSTDAYKGSLTVNVKTANAPPSVFKPWVTVDAFWSNQPPFPATKPTGQGQYSFTSYNARLVKLTWICKQDGYIVNVTGLWNINKVRITTQFGPNGAPINTVRDVTPIVTLATGQLLISSDWQKFTISVDGTNTLEGIEINKVVTTNPICPFSSSASPRTNMADMMQIMVGFRTMPGFPNYNPDLDCNKDQKIDLADLTTVAAHM